MRNVFCYLLFGFSSLSVTAQLGFCTGNSGDAIFTENFGTGTANSPLPTETTTYSYIDGFPDDGFYTVSNGTAGNIFEWHDIEDHTPNDTDGKCLIINAGFSAGEFYRTTISGLCETTTYEFSAWLINLLEVPGFCVDQGIAIPVNVSFQIWDSTDSNLLASGDTGDIIETPNPTWNDYGLVFQTLANQDSVILKMINNGQGGCGNDLAIDDIVFKSCGDIVTVADASNNNAISICNEQLPFATTLTASPDFAVFSTHFYQWQESTDGITWTDIAGETNQNISITATGATFYRTKVAEFAANLNNDQCILLSDVFQLSLNPSPNAPLSNGDIDFNCDINGVTLSVTVPEGILVNWYDSATDGTQLQANSLTYTATEEGTYYAEAVDESTGCISLARTTVSTNAILPMAPISNGDIDFDCDLNEVTLSVTVPAGISVNWYDAAIDGNLVQSNSLTYIVTDEGTYYAEAVDELTGCLSLTKTAISAIIELPAAPISDGDVVFDCALNEAVLSVTVPTGFTVNWYDAEVDGNLLEFDNTTYTATEQGIYYAEAIDETTGCISAIRVAIEVALSLGSGDCIIPQGISPDGSPGQNDEFDLTSYDVQKLEIFNRYGTLVYSKTNYTNEWKGQTNNGDDLPVGTYFYTMEYEGGKSRSAWVYIQRLN